MGQQDKYIDKSGDRKYFTQIPNMIVNHSTAYEQALYLIMKRTAGEGGSCYASLNFLAEKMGVHKTTISKTINKLLKRKWIEETDKTKVRGGHTRTFVIIDLWPRNIKEYESGAETTSRGGAQNNRGGAVVDRGGAQSDTSKKKNKIYNKSSSKLKPYFRGDEMRKAQGKWWVLPKDGGDWLEFAGKEKEIKWK